MVFWCRFRENVLANAFELCSQTTCLRKFEYTKNKKYPEFSIF